MRTGINTGWVSWSLGLLLYHLSSGLCAMESEVPRSFVLGLTSSHVPTVEVRGPDDERIAELDKITANEGRPPAYGVVLPVGVDAIRTGIWSDVPTGGRVLRLKVRSANALGVELYLDEMDLPEGAMLHVYDERGQQLLGAYTAAHVRSNGRFTTAQQIGDACILELYEPPNAYGRSRLRVAELGYAFRGSDPGRSDPCEVDVNCTEGADWADERDGVVRVGTRINGVLFWCTGSLVNNTALDCKPYFLTALHCGLGSTATDLQDYKFYFNYQRQSCGTGSGTATDVITGCHRRADSNDGGGTSGSDFLLLESLDPVPPSFSPYWNGWDATGPGSSSGVSIHHPTGSEKKISTYAMNLLTTQWAAGGPYSHWYVKWTATANGHGVTELGSSGSPLFNADGRIIGTLTGGTSCCVVDGCNLPGSGPNEPDYYGKMQYHWTSNPNDPNEKLKVWLDPLATGVTALDGSRNPCANNVDEHNVPAFELFPVPCAGQLTVADTQGVLNGASMDVVDATGRVAWRSDWTGGGRGQFDLGALPDGVYLLRISRTDRPVQPVRFMIAR
ncbi:MAG: T9SS type A sorting domain-containing protein [Flavobacteriales bacterium]|nr:T9SS type A sorting domain-containing protein [Flavobacteriales bacterium]